MKKNAYVDAARPQDPGPSCIAGKPGRRRGHLLRGEGRVPPSLVQMFSDSAEGPRGRTVWLYAVLIAANGLAWIWALVTFAGQPTLLGTALLAYTLGLRHAVDADHIAAIDNVVRKLMQEGKRPHSVGFFFALGHSTVVLVATLAVAAAAVALEGRPDGFKTIGGLVGAGVSALFLLAIALVNFVIFIRIWGSFQHLRRGGQFEPEHFELLLAGRGLLARLFRKLFRVISKSWHMYPLGLLFGLGFDTATEIGLLGISAAQAAQGITIGSTLIFPILFTAGMALVDTTDGVFMVGAYGWAFANPIRKLWYNLTITGVSVLVALLIGSVEILGLLADKLAFEGGVWNSVRGLKDSLGTFGVFVVGLFVLCWIVSALIYRWNRYDELAPDVARPHH
jgi:nickel/cobalt transporter (NiCoT) family protein